MSERNWTLELASGRPARLFSLARQLIGEQGWDVEGVAIDGHRFRCDSSFDEAAHRCTLVFPTPAGDLCLTLAAAPARVGLTLTWPDRLDQERPGLLTPIAARLEAFLAELRRRTN